MRDLIGLGGEDHSVEALLDAALHLHDHALAIAPNSLEARTKAGMRDAPGQRRGDRARSTHGPVHPREQEAPVEIGSNRVGRRGAYVVVADDVDAREAGNEEAFDEGMAIAFARKVVANREALELALC